MCQDGAGFDRLVADAMLASRIDAASVALTASDGHDYGPIMDLLMEYYGDEETSAYICSQFIDPPHCLRTAAVNIQADSIDPAWQEHFCELEKQGWKVMWQSSMTAEDAEQASQGYFEECMSGLPFMAH